VSLTVFNKNGRQRCSKRKKEREDERKRLTWSPGGGCGKKKKEKRMTFTRCNSSNIVVNHSLTLRDWIESSVQPQQIQCCYNKSDISTRAQG